LPEKTGEVVVDITLGGFVLFLHIGVAIFGFMLAAVMHASLLMLPRSTSVSQARPFAVLVHRLDPLFPFAALALLALGFWLIHLSDGAFHVKDGWVLTSLITLVVVEGLAGALLAPRAKKLVALIEATPEGDVPAPVRAAMLDPFIWDIAHLATVTFLGVVLLMAAKPSGGISILVVGVAAIVAIALSRWELALFKVADARALVAE
jgi:uncharacterized membrane protein